MRPSGEVAASSQKRRILAHPVLIRRATVDEDGHYWSAVAL